MDLFQKNNKIMWWRSGVLTVQQYDARPESETWLWFRTETHHFSFHWNQLLQLDKKSQKQKLKFRGVLLVALKDWMIWVCDGLLFIQKHHSVLTNNRVGWMWQWTGVPMVYTLSKVQKILQNATRSENTLQSFNIEVYEKFFFSVEFLVLGA